MYINLGKLFCGGSGSGSGEGGSKITVNGNILTDGKNEWYTQEGTDDAINDAIHSKEPGMNEGAQGLDVSYVEDNCGNGGYSLVNRQYEEKEYKYDVPADYFGDVVIIPVEENEGNWTVDDEYKSVIKLDKMVDDMSGGENEYRKQYFVNLSKPKNAQGKTTDLTNFIMLFVPTGVEINSYDDVLERVYAFESSQFNRMDEEMFERYGREIRNSCREYRDRSINQIVEGYNTRVIFNWLNWLEQPVAGDFDTLKGNFNFYVFGEDEITPESMTMFLGVQKRYDVKNLDVLARFGKINGSPIVGDGNGCYNEFDLATNDVLNKSYQNIESGIGIYDYDNIKYQGNYKDLLKSRKQSYDINSLKNEGLGFDFSYSQPYENTVDNIKLLDYRTKSEISCRFYKTSVDGVNYYYTNEVYIYKPNLRLGLEIGGIFYTLAYNFNNKYSFSNNIIYGDSVIGDNYSDNNWITPNIYSSNSYKYFNFVINENTKEWYLTFGINNLIGNRVYLPLKNIINNPIGVVDNYYLKDKYGIFKFNDSNYYNGFSIDSVIDNNQNVQNYNVIGKISFISYNGHSNEYEIKQITDENENEGKIFADISGYYNFPDNSTLFKINVEINNENYYLGKNNVYYNLNNEGIFKLTKYSGNQNYSAFKFNNYFNNISIFEDNYGNYYIVFFDVLFYPRRVYYLPDRFKNYVVKYDELPSSGGGEGGDVDLSDYYNKQETDSKISDAIGSQKFKTINGEEITGEGNIEIESGSSLSEDNGVITDGSLEWYSKDYVNYQSGNIPNSEIWYTTDNGEIANYAPAWAWGGNVNVVSNTYENGFGQIKTDGILTTIGNGFMQNQTNVISITLPETITQIGYDFMGGTKVKSIDLSKTKLTKTTNFLFRNCKELVSVKLPDTITQKGSSWFSGIETNGVLYVPVSKKGDSFYQEIIAMIPLTWKVEYYDESGSGEPVNYVVAINGEIHANDGYIDVISKKDGSTEVSFLNFKKINGESIVGGGNIDIKGGGASLSEENGVITDGNFNWYNKEYFDYENGNIPNDEIWYKTNDGQVITGLSGLSSWKSNTYENGIGKIKLNKELTTVGENFLFQNFNLISIKLPDTLTTVGRYFLDNNPYLETIKLPKNLTIIGNNFLQGSRKLKDFEFPENVTTIGNYFLMNSWVIKNIKIGDKITNFDATGFLYQDDQNGTLYYPAWKKDDAVYQSIIAALPSTWTAEPYGPESGSGGSTITETDGIITEGTYQWYDKSKCDLEIAESIEGLQEYVDEQIGNIEELLSRI